MSSCFYSPTRTVSSFYFPSSWCVPLGRNMFFIHVWPECPGRSELNSHPKELSVFSALRADSARSAQAAKIYTDWVITFELWLAARVAYTRPINRFNSSSLQEDRFESERRAHRARAHWDPTAGKWNICILKTCLGGERVDCFCCLLVGLASSVTQPLKKFLQRAVAPGLTHDALAPFVGECKWHAKLELRTCTTVICSVPPNPVS